MAQRDGRPQMWCYDLTAEQLSSFFFLLLGFVVLVDMYYSAYVVLRPALLDDVGIVFDHGRLLACGLLFFLSWYQLSQHR